MNLLQSGSQMTLDFASDVQKAISFTLAETQHRRSAIAGTPYLFIARMAPYTCGE